MLSILIEIISEIFWFAPGLWALILIMFIAFSSILISIPKDKS